EPAGQIVDSDLGRAELGPHQVEPARQEPVASLLIGPRVDAGEVLEVALSAGFGLDLVQPRTGLPLSGGKADTDEREPSAQRLTAGADVWCRQGAVEGWLGGPVRGARYPGRIVADERLEEDARSGWRAGVHVDALPPVVLPGVQRARHQPAGRDMARVRGEADEVFAWTGLEDQSAALVDSHCRDRPAV